MWERLKDSWLRRAAGALIFITAVVVGYSQLQSNDADLERNDQQLHSALVKIDQLRKDQRRDSRTSGLAVCRSQNDVKIILIQLIKESVKLNRVEEGPPSPAAQEVTKRFLHRLKPAKCANLPVAQPPIG